MGPFPLSPLLGAFALALSLILHINYIFLSLDSTGYHSLMIKLATYTILLNYPSKKQGYTCIISIMFLASILL